MKDFFVTYEIAKLLYEFSFDENCIGYYDNQKRFDLSDPISNSTYQSYSSCEGYFAAPLLQQATDWLEEKHQIFIEIGVDCTTYPKFCYSINKFFGNPKDLTEKEWGWEHPKPENWYLYKSRKEATEEAIKFALTLI